VFFVCRAHHLFVYYGDLSYGDFFLDDAYFSSFSALTKTQINGFNFRPEVRGTYTFKFWNGKDANNNNVWIEKTIVVK
jgi:hypothetical protein